MSKPKGIILFFTIYVIIYFRVLVQIWELSGSPTHEVNEIEMDKI